MIHLIWRWACLGKMMVMLIVVIALWMWRNLEPFHNRLLLLLFQPDWRNQIRILVLALTDCYSNTPKMHTKPDYH